MPGPYAATMPDPNFMLQLQQMLQSLGPYAGPAAGGLATAGALIPPIAYAANPQMRQQMNQGILADLDALLGLAGQAYNYTLPGAIGNVMEARRARPGYIDLGEMRRSSGGQPVDRRQGQHLSLRPLKVRRPRPPQGRRAATSGTRWIRRRRLRPARRCATASRRGGALWGMLGKTMCGPFCPRLVSPSAPSTPSTPASVLV